MIANVVFFSTLRKIFDYKIPANIVKKIQVGIRIKAPFGNKNLIGLVVGLKTKSEIDPGKLKSIIEIIDQAPIFDPSLYKTLLWSADYYKNSIGSIIDCALPSYIKENKIPKNNSLATKISDLKFIDPPDIKLNSDQKLIIEKILATSNQFTINLLEGVTGSGKTEIYLQLTAAILKQNKQVLILVPEIGLTPQTCQRFTERFSGVEIAILHSKLTPKQRYINWLKASKGIAKIILGTRTAAFVPLENTGLFILDEEHDLSFKQQEHCNYHARDFLIMRAKHANCPILLGSATPSLESWNNAILKKYNYYKLPARAISELPPIEIIDLRHKKLTANLSSSTIAEIKNHLAAQQQVLLFINRRGFAPIIKCFNCKFVYQCSFCDANMTLHLYTNKLHCHHCQNMIAMPSVCPKCQQCDLMPIGQGTERIEVLFQKIFSNAKIARIDRDSTGKKDDFTKIINDILNEQFNLLIGTQMIAKGHHFPKLSLVVIIDVDHALFSNDFRSTERLGQLLLQVAGRAGREQPGKVIIETSHPNHSLILAIQKYDYDGFCKILLQERKQASLPPFSHQILWKVAAKSLKTCIEFLSKVKELGINLSSSNYSAPKNFGPIPAVMEKRNNKFHARLLFQSINRNALQELHNKLIPEVMNLKLSTKVKWTVEVDPKEI